MQEKMKIVYEDNDILVIDKPAGLLTQNTDQHEFGDESRESVENILKRDYKIDLPRGGIVHRLDRDTSGLMVVAKNEKALVDLQNQFQSHQVKKEYRCLVMGEMEAGEGTIDIALTRDPKNRTRFTASRSRDSRSAITHYKVKSEKRKVKSDGVPLTAGRQCSLVDVNIETGRTHQIRAHFFAIGHPVIGDSVYKTPLSESVSDKLGLSRQFLHAAKLSFSHPATGEKISFESELPEDLEQAIGRIA